MRILIIFGLLTISPMLNAASEADYVNAWCTEDVGETEHVLPDRARVDCLTDTYAIEADYAHKWGEAIGQAMYYASQTGREPGVLLIVGPGDYRYVERLFEGIQASRRHVRVWFTGVQE